MVGKKGWIRILEATIAVMIVMSVLVIVYSTDSRSSSLEELIVVSQDKVLQDISTNKALRLNVLKLVINSEGKEELENEDYINLNDFVNSSLPANLGYSVRVCDLEAISCKLDTTNFVETLNRDVFVDEIIVSSEIAFGEPIYSPRKVRLFVWEKP